MVVFSNIDPITAYLELNGSNISVSYRLLRFAFGAFDIWDFWLLGRFGCFIVFQVMFASYLSLLLLINKLRYNLKSTFTVSQLTEKLKLLILEYNQIQLYTKIINSCFQNSVALPVTMTVMLFGILLGTVALDEQLRSSASIDAFVLSVYTVINMDFISAVGFYIPGLLNARSQSIINTWKTEMVTIIKGNTYSRKTTREIQRIIRAIRDVRIYFGKLNFYEKNTCITILKFMVETTVNLVLLI